MDAAQEWYKKALAAFVKEEQTAAENHRPYLQYRIGKMYAAGLGTERKENCSGEAEEGGLNRDYEKAALWFSNAVSADYKYAQYSLAGLYYRGQGVEQDYEQALHLYECSSEQGNPYADYELAKMFRDGIGTEKNAFQADTHFLRAFNGFFQLERNSHDDKLQYRLGQMLHTGTGTEKDDRAAADFGNVPQSWEISMRSMRLESCGWRVELEIRSRQWDGLRKPPTEEMRRPSTLSASYTVTASMYSKT